MAQASNVKHTWLGIPAGLFAAHICKDIVQQQVLTAAATDAGTGAMLSSSSRRRSQTLSRGMLTPGSQAGTCATAAAPALYACAARKPVHSATCTSNVFCHICPGRLKLRSLCATEKVHA